MKRRNFLGILAAAPLVGLVRRALALTPPLPELAPAQQRPMLASCSDKFEIFSPNEIRQIWGEDRYAEALVIRRNGRTYIVKTSKIKTTIDVELLNGPREIWRAEVQRQAKEYIDRELYYIHSVRFCDPPLVHPQTLRPYYGAWVRGARITPLRVRELEIARNAVDAVIRANNL